MPLFAELAPSAQIRQGENTAMFGEDDRVRTEGRSFVDQKTTVTIKQRGPVAVQLEAFLINQKHGDTRLVLRRIPDLPYLKLGRIDGRFYARPDVLFAGGNVVPIDRRRLRKRRKRVKGFIAVPPPDDGSHCAQ